MSVPEIPTPPVSKPEYHFEMTNSLALQSELVERLWAHLTQAEREVYTQIIDDPRNQLILNIVTVAATVGMKMEHDYAKDELKLVAQKADKIVELNTRVMRAMSGLVLGLSAVSVALLGMLILF